MTAKSQNNTAQTVIVVGCVIFAVLLLSALIINLIKLATLSSRKRELETLMASAEAQIAALESDITLKSSDEFIDSYVREYLDMMGKDEKAFISR